LEESHDTDPAGRSGEEEEEWRGINVDVAGRSSEEEEEWRGITVKEDIDLPRQSSEGEESFGESDDAMAEDEDSGSDWTQRGRRLSGSALTSAGWVALILTQRRKTPKTFRR
jgi:hypothetical protein